MAQPAEFYQGDRVRWLEAAAPADASAVTVWLRPIAAGAAVEVNGVYGDEGWLVELSEAVTAGMNAGEWILQVAAVVDGGRKTIRSGSLAVRQSLAASGTAGGFDYRSQAQKDLEAVEGAIRALTTGAQEYQIGALGNGGRKVRRADLSELIKWRDRLKADVMREKRAEMIAQGLGDPRRLYVRFGGVS
jgi:hypothetical protein